MYLYVYIFKTGSHECHVHHLYGLHLLWQPQRHSRQHDWPRVGSRRTSWKVPDPGGESQHRSFAQLEAKRRPCKLIWYDQHVSKTNTFFWSWYKCMSLIWSPRVRHVILLYKYDNCIIKFWIIYIYIQPNDMRSIYCSVIVIIMIKFFGSDILGLTKTLRELSQQLQQII